MNTYFCISESIQVFVSSLYSLYSFQETSDVDLVKPIKSFISSSRSVSGGNELAKIFFFKAKIIIRKIKNYI